ncbi:Site-specific recombinase XerD [Blastococcus aggregatus]|uniref:Site-specific recombinase XerD n=1 Tax=Blastococcus aggregatus TaxID=38502 RepID=A0A285V184_9ACTN|nr:tyrosine-type recombinase/integrase [Blastococcus aggregatus]SOC47819.1 Site-specific recombinase XerD [Blastococcus aggregatus]
MSRRRDWSPTGVLVPCSRVKLYRRTVPSDSKPEKVIVRLAGLPGERKESFPTKTAAKAYYARLTAAVGLGEDFDTGSFAPTNWGQPSAPEPADQPMTWLAWVCQHIDDMAAAGDKGKTKKSRHEALKVAVWTLVDDVPDHPGRDALKAYLEVVGDPVFVDPALPPTPRDAERARLRAERLAQLPDQVFARRGFGTPRRDVYLPRAEVLTAGEWLTEHSRPVASTTQADAKAVLTAYTFKLDGTFSASTTRNRLRNVFHKALVDAVVADLLPANPMDHLSLRTYASATVRTIDRRIAMDPVMAEAFLDHVDDPYRALAALMVREGLRPSEAVAVRDSWLTLPKQGWGEVELQHAVVAAGTRWTKEETLAYDENPPKWSDRADKPTTRLVPLSPETVDDLRAHKKAFGSDGEGRLFRAARGGPVNPTGLGRAIAAARDATFATADSPHFIAREDHPLRTMTAYLLRHTAASHALNAGVPPKDVADRMGHDVPVLLKVYASVIDADRAIGNQRMETYRANHRAAALQPLAS